MPPAQTSPPVRSSDTPPSGRQPFTPQGKIYVIRIIYSIMVFTMLATRDALCAGRPFEHGWLLIVLAIYPHAGHLLFGRLDIRRIRGRIMLLIDGLIGGAFIAVTGSIDTASIFIAAILLFNWMVVGGVALVVAGASSLAAGMFIMGAAGGIAPPAPADCSLPDWLAGLFLAGYLLIVAGVLHRLVQELGLHQVALQAESDALRHAKALAEGALISALPSGTARQLANHGKIESETIDDATLLLLRMDIAPPRHPALELLGAWLQASDLILVRHGFEMIKTFGSRALVLGRTATPEDGIAAIREIEAYFSNHAPAGLADGEHLLLRAALSSGSVRIGPVQEERLNLELCGAAADALAEAFGVLAEVPEARLVITPAAHARMHAPAGYVFHPADGCLPSHYRPAESGTPT